MPGQAGAALARCGCSLCAAPTWAAASCGSGGAADPGTAVRAVTPRVPLTGVPHAVQNLIAAQPNLTHDVVGALGTACPAESGALTAELTPASAALCMAATSARVDSNHSAR